MAPDTITLMLEGEVSLEAFATAVKSLNSLISALTIEEGGNIEWTVEDLQPGSALATIKGRSPQPERVERVVQSYSDVDGRFNRMSRFTTAHKSPGQR